jgi:peptidoglycan/xylan/chitin deacetylase (PgdA/CDA1 family)
LKCPGGVISFTFDDFPKSALDVGGRILQRYGARGTYYVSMGLAGTNRVVGAMFDEEDVRTAHYTGHEIACHTFSHPNCGSLKRSAILAEIRGNAAALRTVIRDRAFVNFAYPYGAVSHTVKRALRFRFKTCRGIRPGINQGTVDLADLRAIPLYNSEFDQNQLLRLIDHNRAAGGWLIFYTHDLSDTPSRFGCTPCQLETLAHYAAARTTILRICDVVSHIHP